MIPFMKKITYNDNDYDDGDNHRVWLLLPSSQSPLLVYSIHENQDICDDVQNDILDNDD